MLLTSDNTIRPQHIESVKIEILILLEKIFCYVSYRQLATIVL